MNNSIEGLSGYELVATVAYNAGFRGHPLITMISIAKAESDCNPDAVGDVNLQNEKWGPSIGLWQVRSLRHPEKYTGEADKMRIEKELFDPQYNANISYLISIKGTNFSAWSTYTSNAFRKYLNESIDVVSKLGLTGV